MIVNRGPYKNNPDHPSTYHIFPLSTVDLCFNLRCGQMWTAPLCLHFATQVVIQIPRNVESLYNFMARCNTSLKRKLLDYFMLISSCMKRFNLHNVFITQCHRGSFSPRLVSSLLFLSLILFVLASCWVLHSLCFFSILKFFRLCI